MNMQNRRPPYPQSETIVGLTWDDRVIRTGLGPIVNQETQRRDGSDNWPITWADDGDLYVTYGDGYGFEPYLEEKLGLGFARLSGDPDTLTAVNIRSASGENRGSGRAGKKGSGLLMVDGVLYLWLFHADDHGGQAQLAVSTDHAVTWTFGDWRFEQFGLSLVRLRSPQALGTKTHFSSTPITPLERTRPKS